MKLRLPFGLGGGWRRSVSDVADKASHDFSLEEQLKEAKGFVIDFITVLLNG